MTWPFYYVIMWALSQYLWSPKLESGTLLWRDANFKTAWVFDYGVMWHMKKIDSCTSTIPMTTKIGRVVTYGSEHHLQSHVILDYVVMWHMKKNYFCFSTISMATKLGKVVTYCWETPPTKSREPLIPWSLDKYKTLYLHFHNGHHLWLPNLAEGRLLVWGRHSISPVTFWWFDHITYEKPYKGISTILIASKSGRVVTWDWRNRIAKSRDDILITCSHENLKNLYWYFIKAYGSQTWRDGSLWLGTQSTKSCKRFTKWSRASCLLNDFKTFVAILLTILSLLSAVLPKWQNNFDIILFNFSELLALEISKSTDVQMCHIFFNYTTHLTHDSFSKKM